MNNSARFKDDRLIEEELSKRLSHLKPLPQPECIDPRIEEKILQDLAKKLVLKNRLTQICQETGAYWEAALISVLLLLLAWDLFGIIRLLLN